MGTHPARAAACAAMRKKFTSLVKAVPSVMKVHGRSRGIRSSQGERRAWGEGGLPPTMRVWGRSCAPAYHRGLQ